MSSSFKNFDDKGYSSGMNDEKAHDFKLQDTELLSDCIGKSAI